MSEITSTILAKSKKIENLNNLKVFEIKKIKEP